MWELFIPQSCAGCGQAGQALCAACRQRLREVPHLTNRDVGVPVWALGDYTRLRRNLIIQMKEYNNRTVRPLVGAVFAAGIKHLQAQGHLPYELVLVPAPTRSRSARLRGGDPVLQVCKEAAGQTGAEVAAALQIRAQAADQSELGADERWMNMRQAVELRQGGLRGKQVLLVDDVVTTGATLAASAAVLQAAGAVVRGALVLADAR